MKKLIISLAVIILGLIVLFSIPNKIQSFEEIYGQEDEFSSSLKLFREIPLKIINIDGEEWKYLITGEGDENILFLHGMTGSYDVWWQQINFLKSNYRIITLTYPSVNSLEKMGGAVLKILDKEGFKKIYVVGSSLGGYFTQYLIYNYPERVEKAVFANTFPVNDQIKEENKNKAWLLKNVPEWLLMAVMRKGLYKDILPAGNNSKVLEAMMIEQFSGSMTQEQFVARYQCVVDKFEQTEKLNIPVLIIESDNDPLVKPNLRKKLKEVYPYAEVVTLHDAGHFPYLSEPDEYNKILEIFLGSEKDTLNFEP
ncbi:MAG: alpha/beta hydrolase [Bacteroidetes bacterium]|nr:MAG: alpha/beta hydrolase [Bacteroidota bacterium]